MCVAPSPMVAPEKRFKRCCSRLPPTAGCPLASTASAWRLKRYAKQVQKHRLSNCRGYAPVAHNLDNYSACASGLGETFSVQESKREEVFLPTSFHEIQDSLRCKRCDSVLKSCQ